MENEKYQVSAHCKTRYAERIMGKEEKSDVVRFVSLNEDKINTDINKMIEYGNCIYSGRQSQKDELASIIEEIDAVANADVMQTIAHTSGQQCSVKYRLSTLDGSYRVSVTGKKKVGYPDRQHRPAPQG